LTALDAVAADSEAALFKSEAGANRLRAVRPNLKLAHRKHAHFAQMQRGD